MAAALLKQGQWRGPGSGAQEKRGPADEPTAPWPVWSFHTPVQAPAPCQHDQQPPAQLKLPRLLFRARPLPVIPLAD